MSDIKEEVKLPVLNVLRDKGVLQDPSMQCVVYLFIAIEEGRLTLTLRGTPFIQPLHFMTMDEFIEKHNDGNKIILRTTRYIDHTTECVLTLNQDPTVMWDVATVKRFFVETLSMLHELDIYFRKEHIVAYNCNMEMAYVAFNRMLHKQLLQRNFTKKKTFQKLDECCRFIKAAKLFCRYRVDSACMVFGYQSCKDWYGVQLSVNSWLRSETGFDELDDCVAASPPFKGTSLKTYYVTFKRICPTNEQSPTRDSQGFLLQTQGLSYGV